MGYGGGFIIPPVQLPKPRSSEDLVNILPIRSPFLACQLDFRRYGARFPQARRREARRFYVDGLGLPVLFEDEIAVVVGGPSGRVVLHRNDRGHDERGIFPAGSGVGGAAVRFTVADPDACERDAVARGLSVVWPTQEAAWGRFVVLADPDGRSVVLAKMRPIAPE